MKKTYLAFILFCFAITMLTAAPGDTTSIRVHNNTQMVWYNNYDQWKVFPAISPANVNRVLLEFRLGCATTKCSDWDYDVNIEIGKKTGLLDSSIVDIDTITTSPLVVDTTWQTFDAVKYYELGRFITPYGTYMDQTSSSYGTAGFNKNWFRRFYYDITDFTSMLHDSVVVRLSYHGWSEGFSGTTDFKFIEGAPPAPVINQQEIYKFSGGYQNSSQFETNYFKAVPLTVPAGTQRAKIRMIMTGHGQDGEFIPFNFFVKLNNTLRFTQQLWRTDCGTNPTSPQGGTWIYNRANWCPGEKVNYYEFDVTPYITAGQVCTFNFDFQNFTPSTPSAASYSVSAYLISYGAPNFTSDAALEEIISPNTHENYLLRNAICSQPEVVVANNGVSAITALQFKYSVNGGYEATSSWSGSIAPHSRAKIKLNTFDWGNADLANKIFNVQIASVNGGADNFMANNQMACTYNMPPVMPQAFTISFRTNARPDETAYYLINSIGDTVMSRAGGLLANKTYNDLVGADLDCYRLIVKDFNPDFDGGDGLSWWANAAAGSGFIRFLDFPSNVTLKNFNADFGNGFEYQFTAMLPIDEFTVGMPDANRLDQFVEVYPNPASDAITVDFSLPTGNETITIRLSDMLGHTYQTTTINDRNGRVMLNADELAAGLYFVQVSNGSATAVKKILVSK